ncbi:hypothetical protein [Pannus brasiliensis]|uniref:hypothetical protein n=1 Tax=Pannus brasiliensis TaxID=1579216 RepID=UPI003BEEDE60
MQFSVGYVAGNNNNSEVGNGLFNGTYHALAQLAWYGNNGAWGRLSTRSRFRDSSEGGE